MQPRVPVNSSIPPHGPDTDPTTCADFVRVRSVSGPCRVRVRVRVVEFSYNTANKYGEVTSQNLWPRYDRNFAGITWHNVWR